MAYLLDTHTLLWFLAGDRRLSASAQQAIESSEAVYVSVASLWEISIKASLSKLTLLAPFETLFPAQLDLNGFTTLPIEWPHLYVLQNLPFHHRDPFDRLLIAQAMHERLILISADTAFSDYSVAILW